MEAEPVVVQKEAAEVVYKNGAAYGEKGILRDKSAGEVSGKGVLNEKEADAAALICVESL